MMLHNQYALPASCHMIVVMTYVGLIRRSGGGARAQQIYNHHVGSVR